MQTPKIQMSLHIHTGLSLLQNYYIVPDNMQYFINQLLIFFLFLHKNLCCVTH